MARPRTYRHDVRCPDRGSNRRRKDGHARGKQSYSFGECKRRYLPDTPGSVRTPAPLLGQHTDEVLAKFGYADADIAALRDSGALGGS